MRRSKKSISFWQEQLKLALVEQEKLYDKLQYYLRWQAKGNLSRGIGFPGGAVFICMRNFRERDKHKLIKMQRKMQQIKSTKIPYFLERIVQEA